jgi:hypothetical protein
MATALASQTERANGQGVTHIASSKLLDYNCESARAAPRTAGVRTAAVNDWAALMR